MSLKRQQCKYEKNTGCYDTNDCEGCICSPQPETRSVEADQPLLCEVGKLIKLYDDHIDCIINNFQKAAEYAEKYGWLLDDADKYDMLDSLEKVKVQKGLIKVVFKVK